VKSRFGKNLDEFWRRPAGNDDEVRSQMIKLSPDEEALRSRSSRPPTTTNARR
jgi:hypothetical protein